jgi:hypothetical protein
MTRLTIKRLEAMSHALSAKLAGELEDYENHDDYDKAADWVAEELHRRRSRKRQPEMF